LEARVDPVRVVIADVVSEKSTQMALIEDDHVIDKFALA
jgi:hypothetical protein